MQGLTEFLPVSSSGHLVVMQHLFGLDEPQLLFDVMLHVGTLCAVVVVFRKDLWGILNGLWAIVTGHRRHARPAGHDESVRLLWFVIIASIPTGIIGLSLKDVVETLFGSVRFVGVAFLITGVILWASRFARRPSKHISTMTAGDALVIGFVQGIAVTPGISRSGTTISGGLLLGIDRELTARFSFLLAIPAILGAAVVELRDVTAVPQDVWPAILAGTAVASVSGYLSLKMLLRVVIAGNFSTFAYYCWGMGVLTLVGSWYGLG